MHLIVRRSESRTVTPVRLLNRSHATVLDHDSDLDLERAALGMVENVAINVMFADNDYVIRYVNPASLRTLRAIQHLLPVPADHVVGSSIDIFHRRPEHQREVLAHRVDLPHRARFPLGDQWVDLTADAVTDARGADVGVLVNWSLVTDEVRIEREITEITHSVATAVEEMRASIGEIASSASQSVAVSDRAQSAANEVDALMERLRERLVEIDKVVDFIAGVAEQTNLLALNATIEAARAGEVGRGFAVVAGEVKELATETDSATDNIRASVRALQTDAHEMQVALSSMAGLVGTVQQNSSSIAAAVEEQTAVAHEISQQAAMASQVVTRQR